MAKKVVSVKFLAVMMSAVLVLGGVIGGTFAWLIDETEEVVNTFTYGDINITLEESDTNLDGDNDPSTNQFEMLPGREIEKDPVVTVKEGSENSWVFVQLTKSANYDDFMEGYTVADGWVQLKDKSGAEVEGVFYRYQEGPAADVEYSVLKDDKVVVKGTVTKAKLNALDADPANPTYPTLTVKAYAVQYEGFEPNITDGAAAPTDLEVNDAAYDAWEAILNQPTNP